MTTPQNDDSQAREALLQAVKKWIEDARGSSTIEVSSDVGEYTFDLAKLCNDAILLALQALREEDCKAVCDFCKHNPPVFKLSVGWRHEYFDEGDGDVLPCAATNIRSSPLASESLLKSLAEGSRKGD